MRASLTAFLCVFFLMLGGLWQADGQDASSASNPPITNLLQLVNLLKSNARLTRDIQLEATVCAASDSAVGVVILQDPTATVLVEFSGGTPTLSPGDRVDINRKNCLLRRREMGVQISAAPIVNNDGIHAHATTSGGLWLNKGRHSLTVEWFNNQRYPPYLWVKWKPPGSRFVAFANTNLFSLVADRQSGQTNLQPGLQAACYEGDWEQVPNFDLLKPVKTTVVTNFDMGIRPRDEMAGIRFQGFFDAPQDGVYSFQTRSADGCLLFVDNPDVPIKKLGKGPAPKPVPVTIDQPLSCPTKQRWVTVVGRVAAVRPLGRGLEMEMHSDRNVLRVRMADAAGLNTSNLLNSKIRITGVEEGMFDPQGRIILGQVFAANAKEVEMIRAAIPLKNPPLPLAEAQQVQTLPLAEAKQHLPIRLRGVVTSKGGPYDYWISVQDDTRGIFVDFHGVSNSVPMCGDYYEVIGHSGAGNFAPVVIADRLVRLGRGEFPEPRHPTWDELNNGSMDVQWVEFDGLVTDVHSNMLSMLLPAGQMKVQVEGPSLTSLKTLKKAVVRIRGVLFAMWNTTREVRVGSVLMRNASITVEIPAPTNPFDAVLKTPQELLLFDAQASAFRRVKVRGQIIYSDATESFLQEDGKGLRLLPADKVNLKPGDLVEAVGYPNISKSSMVLREAIIRKTGEAGLPSAKKLSASLSDLEDLDSTCVRIEGRLLGWHFEQHQAVLEMQSGTHLYLARLARFNSFSLRVGSELALTGVLVNQRQRREGGAEAFELLLNSSKAIHVLSEPSWWTLERLVILVGILVAILVLGAVWITQLRRVVELRTTQLQQEIQERELAEKQHALEMERSRIAQDLHDDLGASLTEITVLGNKGQRASSDNPGAATLFRRMTEKARELVSALDIIVWAVDPKDNSLQSVADYLCDFTDEYLSPSGIACRFDVPVTLPLIVLNGRVRHDLFLAVKETLNNIVRHAGATEVQFRIAVANQQLEIIIADNGKGFDPVSPQGGKGLRGLSNRFSRIDGSCEIQSTPGKGTTVKIAQRLPSPGVAASSG